MNILRRLNNPKAHQRLYRNRHLRAKELNLSDPEYRLWDLYGAVSGWDKKYNEIFEMIHATDEQIAEILNWSPSKTCRTRNELIKKGLIKEQTRGIYKILFIPSPDSETAVMPDKNAQMQPKLAPMEIEPATTQANPGINSESPLYSSKGIYTLLRTKDEYIRVKNRVNDLTKKITEVDGWLSDNPKLKAMVEEQQRLANLMLTYEIEHDLVPL